jgi:hypothetical protein
MYTPFHNLVASISLVLLFLLILYRYRSRKRCDTNRNRLSLRVIHRLTCIFVQYSRIRVLLMLKLHAIPGS